MGKKAEKRKRGDEARWEEIERLTNELQTKLIEPKKAKAATTVAAPDAAATLEATRATAGALSEACNKLLLLRIADVVAVTTVEASEGAVDTCLAALAACMKGQLRVDEGEEGGEEGDGLEAVAAAWRELVTAYAKKAKKGKKKDKHKAKTLAKRARTPNEVVARLEAADALYFALWTWARDAGEGREESEVGGASSTAVFEGIPGPATYFRSLEDAVYRDTNLAADLRSRLTTSPLSCERSLSMLEKVWGLRADWVADASTTCPWEPAACNPLLAFYRARW
jgi:hypothetical protein